VRFMMLIGQI